MSIKSIIRLSVLFPLLFIFGCDCVFDYKFKVVNKTSSELNFNYKTNGKTHIIKLTPDEEKEILITEGFRCGCTNCTGSRINSVDSSMSFIMTEIIVQKNDTIISKTNFNNEYNWDFESKKKLGIYKAMINESDF